MLFLVSYDTLEGMLGCFFFTSELERKFTSNSTRLQWQSGWKSHLCWAGVCFKGNLGGERTARLNSFHLVLRPAAYSVEEE